MPQNPDSATPPAPEPFSADVCRPSTRDSLIRSFTPPRKRPRTSEALAIAIEEARAKITRKPSAEVLVPCVDGSTQTASDPLPRMNVNGTQLSLWSADVQVVLAMYELVPTLEFVGGADNVFATANIKPGPSSLHLATIERPRADRLLSLDPNKHGLGWVRDRSKGADRKSKALAIEAQDLQMDRIFMAALGFDEESAPAAAAVLGATMEFAGLVAQLFKHHLVVPRPYELTNGAGALDPMLPHPGHASFPAGHAAQAAALAVVMNAVAGARLETHPNGKNPLSALADDIADNREYAGLHYRVDTLAGLALGQSIGEALLAMIRTQAATELAWRAVKKITADGDISYEDAKGAIEPRPLWARMFASAKQELR